MAKSTEQVFLVKSNLFSEFVEYTVVLFLVRRWFLASWFLKEPHKLSSHYLRLESIVLSRPSSFYQHIFLHKLVEGRGGWMGRISELEVWRSSVIEKLDSSWYIFFIWIKIRILQIGVKNLVWALQRIKIEILGNLVRPRVRSNLDALFKVHRRGFSGTALVLCSCSWLLFKFMLGVIIRIPEDALILVRFFFKNYTELLLDLG